MPEEQSPSPAGPRYRTTTSTFNCKTTQIKLWVDDEYLNGRITCDIPLYSKYEVYETDHRFELQWWGGYTRHNCIWKRITNLSTGEETTELVTENNAIMMYNPMLER